MTRRPPPDDPPPADDADATTRYRRSRASSTIDWSSIDYVVGTRQDVTFTGIKRPCSRCDHDVYTSRRYPAYVNMICEYCALELAEEERSTVTGPGPGPTLDPWRRVAAPRTRGGRTPGKRRLATPPKPSDPDPTRRD